MIKVLIGYFVCTLVIRLTLPIFRWLYGRERGVVTWMLFWIWIIAALFLVWFCSMTGLKIR